MTEKSDKSLADSIRIFCETNREDAVTYRFVWHDMVAQIYSSYFTAERPGADNKRLWKHYDDSD